MSSFTLADIQKAAEKKYGDFEVEVPTEDGIETVRFRPILRCSREVRKEYAKATDPLAHTPAEGEEADIVDVLLAAAKAGFRTIARSARDFELLDEALKVDGQDDLALWQELFRAYNEDSEAGEA